MNCDGERFKRYIQLLEFSSDGHLFNLLSLINHLVYMPVFWLTKHSRSWINLLSKYANMYQVFFWAQVGFSLPVQKTRTYRLSRIAVKFTQVKLMDRIYKLNDGFLT